MSLLLYAITEGSPGARVGQGVSECLLRTVGEEGLVAVVSEHQHPPVLSEESVWEFERVIETQMTEHAVLPARFGTVIEDAPTLEAILRDRRDELGAKLTRIRDAVELGVRATWSASEAPTRPLSPTQPGAGTSYMLGRLERDTRARTLATRIGRELDGLARASRYQVFARPTTPVTAAYLVDSGRTDEFVTRVRALESALPDTELVCTGPWPPYSFVGSETDD